MSTGQVVLKLFCAVLPLCSGYMGFNQVCIHRHCQRSEYVMERGELVSLIC